MGQRLQREHFMPLCRVAPRPTAWKEDGSCGPLPTHFRDYGQQPLAQAGKTQSCCRTTTQPYPPNHTPWPSPEPEQVGSGEGSEVLF